MVTVEQYLSLLTSEHQGKPLLAARLTAILQPLGDLQNLYASLVTLFDIDTAVGSQLDIVGQWVGVSRTLAVPLTGVFFSWDTDGLGWDQGNWQGPYQTGDTLYELGDDDYRLLLKTTIAKNHWTGKTLSTYDVLQMAFAGTGITILIQDNQDMSIDILVAGPLTAVQQALLLGGYYTLKGSGVLINGYFFIPEVPLFGFDVENGVVSGWDVGTWLSDSI
jgi:hypothetical protein